MRPRIASKLAAAVASTALLVACGAKHPLPVESTGDSRASELEKAWQGLTDSMQRSSEILSGPEVPSSSLVQAEGYNYLTRLLNLGLSRYLHHGDPEFPTLGRLDLMAKFGGDNPDNLYQNAPIDGGATYRVRGTRGTVLYVEFTVGAGFPGMGKNRVISRLDTSEIEIAEDGSFEIWIGPEPHPGNWLRTEPGVRGTLMVRQVFGDWENERRAEFWVEREASNLSQPPDLDAVEMSSRLRELAHFLEVQSKLWVDYVKGVQDALPRNQLPRPQPPRGDLLGSRSFFSLGYFEIGTDEALIVEVEPHAAGYMGFQLTNYWFESLDYANRTTSLNGHQARRDPDGKTRLVVTDRDPGVPNWVDTAGQREGVMLVRFALTDSAPALRTRIVDFEQIWESIPPDTPRIDAAERGRQIRVRQEHVARRYFP